MSSVGVVVTTACPRCGITIPVNGILHEAGCAACRQSWPITDAAWTELLVGPAIDGPRAEPNKENIASVGGHVRNYARRPATCARCNAELPLPRGLEHAARGWCICVECGERISVRALPPELRGMGGVTHVIGEDLSGIVHADVAHGTEGIVAQCPKCGASLPCDGANRAIVCKHCHSQVVLPDAIWARLHPLSRQRMFFLWHDPASVPQATGALDLKWSDACDVIADRNGNLYFLGSRGDDDSSLFMNENLSVWSTDAKLAFRWSREKLPFKGGSLDDARMAFAPSGHLLIWKEGRHGLVVVSAADGSTVATVGGKEPPGVTMPTLDLERCTSLTCDLDGSILTLMHHRIMRWTADGQPLETWPVTAGVFGAKRQKILPLYRTGSDGDRDMIEPEEHPDLKAVGKRPVDMYTNYACAHIGWDGTLIIQYSETLARLDREGNFIWRVEIPTKGSDRGRPQMDGWGNVYSMWDIGSNANGIYRISQDGRDVRLVVDGRLPNTPLSNDHVLLVLPDATMMTFSGNGEVRIFAGDGSVRFISEASRKEDASNAERRQEEDE